MGAPPSAVNAALRMPTSPNCRRRAYGWRRPRRRRNAELRMQRRRGLPATEKPNATHFGPVRRCNAVFRRRSRTPQNTVQRALRPFAAQRTAGPHSPGHDRCGALRVPPRSAGFVRSRSCLPRFPRRRYGYKNRTNAVNVKPGSRPALTCRRPAPGPAGRPRGRSAARFPPRGGSAARRRRACLPVPGRRPVALRALAHRTAAA